MPVAEPILARSGGLAGARPCLTAPRRDPAGQRLLALVAASRGLDPALLTGPSRDKADVAFARQVAMYLMHVSLSRTLVDTGRFFNRDRTTVAHACALVEDRREDAGLDAELDALDALLSTGRAQ